MKHCYEMKIQSGTNKKILGSIIYQAMMATLIIRNDDFNFTPGTTGYVASTVLANFLSKS